MDHAITHSVSLNTKHLDAGSHKAWIADVKAALPALLPLRTAHSTRTFFLDLMSAITLANEKHFPLRKLPRAQSQPWWNAECMSAAHCLHLSGHGGHNNCHSVQKHLKRTVQLAKRDWAAKTIRESSIWDVAQWHHS